MGPFDACIIVVAEDLKHINIRNSAASRRDAPKEIGKVNNLLQGGICGANFCFTWAERCAFLILTKPTNWSTIFKDNAKILLQNLIGRKRVPTVTKEPN